jgi:hypothetical protein
MSKTLRFQSGPLRYVPLLRLRYTSATLSRTKTAEICWSGLDLRWQKLSPLSF